MTFENLWVSLTYRISDSRKSLDTVKRKIFNISRFFEFFQLQNLNCSKVVNTALPIYPCIYTASINSNYIIWRNTLEIYFKNVDEHYLKNETDNKSLIYNYSKDKKKLSNPSLFVHRNYPICTHTLHYSVHAAILYL